MSDDTVGPHDDNSGAEEVSDAEDVADVADVELLAELGDAMRSAAAVPDRFVFIGKEVFTWQGVDFELATLLADSMPVGVRSGPGGVRMLTFELASHTLEVELTAHSLAGQLIPPTPSTVELQDAGDGDGGDDRDGDAGGRDGGGDAGEDVGSTGARNEVSLDDQGWFELRPAPDRPFRLCLRFESGAVHVTPRVTP